MDEYKENKYTNYNQKIEEIENSTGYKKSFFISSLFGTGFGLLFIIISFIYQPDPDPFIYIIPLLCGSVAGIAGIMGNFFDRYMRKSGLKNNILRSILVFTLVLIISILITFTVISLYDSDLTLIFLLNNNLLYGVLIGCFFGVIVMILEYNSWKTKKKMLILELENRYLEELTEKDEILQEASKNLFITEERNRMARELHDSISQGIHGIIYSTKSLQNYLQKDKIDIEQLKKIIEHLETTAEVTLGELRSMILELKPVLLEDKGLYKALVLLLDLFSKRQQIELTQEIEEIEELTPEQEVAIYRIVQEALTNIQKHSDADIVSVSLKKNQEGIKSEERKIILTIQDNGKGFDCDNYTEGNGLRNIRLRSEQNGGEIKIESHPGKGTLINVLFKALITRM